VLHYILDKHGADPRRTKVAGYGDQHPVADNTSRGGRSENRRVVITIGSKTDVEKGYADRVHFNMLRALSAGTHPPKLVQPVAAKLTALAISRRMNVSKLANRPYFGCAITRRYGFGDSHPSGYFFLASSLLTAGRITTLSPSCQLAGVPTLCVAVN
jgi:hypothetical protein